MILRFRPGLAAKLTLVFGMSLLYSAGCSSEPKPLSASDAEENSRQSKLRELGEMLYLHKGDSGKAPSSAANLAKYEAGFQLGYIGVKSGEVVLIWGAPIQEGASDKILAYEKVTPESGGYVLMQDGSTVKKLTADEFKAASLAPGSAPAAKTAN